MLQAICVFGVLLFMGLTMVNRFHKTRLKEARAGLEKARKALGEQSGFLRLGSEATRSAVWDSRSSAGRIHLSAQWFAMLGHPPREKELTLEEVLYYVHPEDRLEVGRLFENYISGDGLQHYEGEHRLQRADGTWRWVLSTAKAVEWDKKGVPTRIIGLDVDIQTLKETREKMARSEARFRALFKKAPLPLANISLDGKILELNDRLVEAFGYTLDTVPTLEHAWNVSMPDPELRNRAASTWQKDLERAMAENTVMTPFECPLISKDGVSRTMVIGTELIGDGIIVSFFDVTERKKAEEAMDYERRQLLSIFNSLDEIIYVSDPSTHEMLFANRRLQDLIGKDPTGGLCHKELQRLDEPCDFRTNQIILNNGGMPHRWEYHNPVTSTDVAIVDQIIRWPDGRDVRLEIAVDVTENKKAEEERKNLEEQLHQSQKLEAIGILAGGVAHDFNNMLGAIMGHAELTMRQMDPDDPFRKNLGRILDAAERSARLTHQLLAFARKQTIEPIVFDLNESVESMLKMMRWLIGENIELNWLPGEGSYTVKMDPSQLDQILVNLCVNARDAIGDVGKVTIETDLVSFDETCRETHSWLTSGEYVLLAVSDDGRGMERDLEPRV